MPPMVTLFWLFRGKLEMEKVEWFNASSRRRQLEGCTQVTVYKFDTVNGEFCVYLANSWRKTTEVPDEIKLAAMLLN